MTYSVIAALKPPLDRLWRKRSYRSLKNIFINPQLLRSRSELRANILEAIEDAQQFRER